MDQNMLGGFPILSIMVYLPVLTALVLLFVKYNERSDDATKKRNGDAIRWVAFGGAVIDLDHLGGGAGPYMSKYFNSGIAQADSFDFQEHFAWLTDLRHRLPHGRGRTRPAPAGADHAAHCSSPSWSRGLPSRSACANITSCSCSSRRA